MAQPPKELAERTRIEVEVAASANAFGHGITRYGELSIFTCPECHGALVKLTEGTIVRYRCHTGHSFTASALLAGITETVGESLWQVTRALEEGVMLLDQMAGQLKDAGRNDEAERFSQKARQTQERSRVLQELAIDHEHLSQDVLRDPTDGDADARAQAG